MLGRLARCLALLALVAVVVPGSALADTSPGTVHVDVYAISAAISFERDGATWSGYASVEDERISGYRVVSASFAAPGQSRTCDNGTPDPLDDYTGTSTTEFFSTRATTNKLLISDSLAAGTVVSMLTGTRVTTDACSGEIIKSRTEHHSFAMRVTATGIPESGEDIFIVDNGDGTHTEVTDRHSSVAALGTAAIDGNVFPVSDATLSHGEQIPREL
jgi:hypothetical protein